MYAIAATIAAALSAGAAAERRFGDGARRAARLVLGTMLYALVPFITFFNIARLHIDANVGGGIALGYVALAITGGAAFVLAGRALSLSAPATGSLMCSVIQGNTGYLGLPLVVALLGAHRLGEAVAYDSLVQAPTMLVAGFGVGAAFGTRAGDGARARLRSFAARNPPLLAVIAGLLAPRSLAPDVLVHVSRGLVVALLPLGFFAVGVTLAGDTEKGAIRFPPPFTRAIGVAMVLRLLVAPALLVLLALPLIHLPAPYLLLAAMPCGINGLVIAHAYGLDVGLSAGAIAWSTALVVLAGLIAVSV
ncbi:MAG: malate permease [Solirubrobacteraceae bacterium]|jgi:predicted permease|nr:malate permease [Solirubrobacteraceae bacterium]